MQYGAGEIEDTPEAGCILLGKPLTKLGGERRLTIVFSMARLLSQFSQQGTHRIQHRLAAIAFQQGGH